MASLVASLSVLLPQVAGTTVAPRIFMRATLGACRSISTSPIYTMHSIPIKAHTVAVATPCCPAPVSAILVSLYLLTPALFQTCCLHQSQPGLSIEIADLQLQVLLPNQCRRLA